MGRETSVRKLAREVERPALMAFLALAGDRGTSGPRVAQRGILNRLPPNPKTICLKINP